MRRDTKLLLLFFLILISLVVTKFIKEYGAIQKNYQQIALHEAHSLNHMIQAFSKSYSDLLSHLDIPVNKETLQLRPVLRLNDVSQRFSTKSDTNAQIKTVSLNPMNPLNMATEDEKKILDFFIKNPDKTEHHLNLDDGIILYANALKAKPKCLKCHGLQKDAPAVIRDNFSSGFDYKVNDILGMRMIQYQNKAILDNMLSLHFRDRKMAAFVFSCIFIVIFLLIRYSRQQDKRHLEELNKHNKNLTKEQQRLTTLLNAMDIAIVFENTRGIIKHANSAFNKVWNLPNDACADETSLKAVLDQAPTHVINEIKQASDKKQTQSQLYLNTQKILIKNQLEIKDSNGESFGKVTLFEDVTAKHQANNKLTYLAEHDALTGLFNRHKFQIELDLMASLNQRNNDFIVLFFFDLDDFKIINDNYGHEQGDIVLIKIANMINTIIRPTDIFCRLGGDEFAILAPMKTKKEVDIFAQRLLQTISSISFKFGSEQIRLTASLGCAFCTCKKGDCENLLAQADIALYSSKSKGKNTVSIYKENGEDNNAISIARLSWNEKIDHGLEQNLFELHFQGIYSIKTGEIAHLEALIRLKDEDNPEQLIMPNSFIPFAEKSGKILDIDRWVIKNTCKMLGENSIMPSVAINISGRSFDQPDLPRYIAEQLELNAVKPKRLLIELTETEAVSDIMDAKAFIESLHELGCPVCLDDFGSGFSSFSYLKHLTVEILKIDGIFITDLTKSYENQLFVESIQHVVNGMKKQSIAEYVENAETLLKLRELGVDMVQGYHLDMPQKNHPALTKHIVHQELIE